MIGLGSRKEKKRILELDSNGIAIEEVYGSKRTSSLFLCLTKALIIFMVCTGTITGFCGAFKVEYNKGMVVFFIAVISLMVSMLYVNKKLFYIGYFLLLILFTVELLRYYLYANSGFQAITNIVRKAYGDHFNMLVIRTSEETYSNRNITVTIALIFIAVFLIIMYNITVSRYMNFAETFAISFILLEIPLYIGLKPPLFSVILTMTGCIATGLLQRGSFNRVTVPGKKAPDYIKDRFFKKNYFTTRGSHKGILMIIAFAAVFSFFICVFSLPAYERGLGETEEDSAKAALDDNIKILVQNGLSGFFDRYDSLNGLARGALGGVSSVTPDFQTDLVVEYVPHGTETIYLRGFIGADYTGKRWDGYLSVVRKKANSSASDQDSEDEKERAVIMADSIKNLDEGFTREILENDETAARMRINYIDMSFGMLVTPYITLSENVVEKDGPIRMTDESGKEMISMKSADIGYVPLSEAAYKVNDDGSPINREDIRVREITQDFNIGYDNYVSLYKGGSTEIARYLGTFLKEHDNLGLNLMGYKNAANRKDTEAMNDFALSACAAIKELFLKEYPYSLTPGKTPEKEDFVKYFLETQKRGYCSHYASAAAMILRYLGIPSRYVEGYCIPASLLQETGKRKDEDGSSWYKAENSYNPENYVYSLEVSDYYAHAWVEVYIEGKGFVPYEVTPPNFEDVTPASTGGIGGFLQRLLNVDLGIGNDAEESLTIKGDVGQAVIEEEGLDLTILIIPLGIVIGIVIVFWVSFLLIKKLIKELRYKGWLKRGEFVPLVYNRYCDLVRKLKKKKIIESENPLPMELSKDLTGYCSKRNESGNAAEEKTGSDAAEIERIFRYVERVLYSSSHASSAEEYEKYYAFIKTF